MMLLIIIALTSFIAVNGQTSEDEDFTQSAITEYLSPIREDVTVNSAENSQITRRGAVARKKCRYFKDYFHNLEIPSSLENNRYPVNRSRFDNEPMIFNGTKAVGKEFPHMVALGYDVPSEGKVWRCGGTLVSTKCILTAAHCIRNTIIGPPLYARVGDLNLVTDDDDAKPQEQVITKRTSHPDYKPPSMYDDIGVLEVNWSFDLTVYVIPACLSRQRDIDKISDVIATGWGETETDTGSNDLLKVQLKVVDNGRNSNCNEIYQTMSPQQFPNGIYTRQQLCAGETGKDTCLGDSGGPLVVPEDSEAFLTIYDVVGVTSVGKGCGLNVPGIYSKVYYYLDWLESTIWPEDYKRSYEK